MGSYLANGGGPRLLLVLYQLRPIIEPGTQKTLRDNNNHHMGEKPKKCDITWFLTESPD